MSQLVRLDDLDALMQKVRADVEARKLRSGSQALGAVGVNIVPPPIEVNRKRYTAVELLASYDAVFMRSVFLAIMGREPVDEEAAQLLQQLRLGQISRIDVIDTLLKTHDAHARGVVISGLGRQRILDRMRRSIVMRKVAALARIARNIPRLASYMRQVISRVDNAERKVQQLELLLAQASQERQASEAMLQQQISALASRIDALQEDEVALNICASKKQQSSLSLPMRAGL